METSKVIEAIKKLREDKRKFTQSVEIIINLRGFDIKKESVNLFLELPHKTREIKVGAFLTKKSELVDSILKADLDKYKEKKKAKSLIKNYDFFIASAVMMPTIAAALGKYLGPAGKMPSPQLGIVRNETDAEIKECMRKLERVVRVKSKEPSLKFVVGKENMKEEAIAENFIYAFNAVLNALPKKKENLKNVLIKFTMTKPIKLEI